MTLSCHARCGRLSRIADWARTLLRCNPRNGEKHASFLIGINANNRVSNLTKTCSRSGKQESIREVIMTAMASTQISDHGTTCTKCGGSLTAPEWSERMSDEQVHYLWCCTNCGNEFETAINSPVDTESKMSEIDWEHMFPPLLVA
jgi:DNA-directed RNA polymerase subunit M/transcription elongation factor TFIIS